MARPDRGGRMTGRKALFLFGDTYGGTQEYAGADGRRRRVPAVTVDGTPAANDSKRPLSTVASDKE